MDISCAFLPFPDTPDHIALAERLGYRRAWVYDTPALQLGVHVGVRSCNHASPWRGATLVVS
ncbi:MAG: hypothetical protein Q8P98_01020 [Candidatus Rokubacteria bacterium]|nr:hypothetical protein [Candidatus Rokubacteria bacterium]